MRVLIIRGIKDFCGSFFANDRCGGEYLGRLAGLGEPVGDFCLDGIDEHIERLRVGDTLSENVVRVLCDKVRRKLRKADKSKTY